MSAIPDRAKTAGAGTTLRQVAGRSFSNLDRTRAIVLARMARRRTVLSPAGLWRHMLLWGVAVLYAGLLLDPAMGAFFGEWRHGPLSQVAEYSTRAALGGIYIFPALAVLAWANLTDWSRWRGRRLLVIYNRTILAMFLLVSVASSGLLVNLLKYGIGRARPMLFAQYGAYHFEPFAMTAVLAGFPSGHATTAGAVATLVVLLFPSARYPAAAVALWVATTRIVLGSHYPSDIVAGLGLGAAVTLALAVAFARLGYLFRLDAGGFPAVKKTALVLR